MNQKGIAPLIIVAVIVVVAIVAGVGIYATTRGGGGTGGSGNGGSGVENVENTSEVTIYGVNAEPYYTSSSFGLELTIYGNVRESVVVDVETPYITSSYSETCEPFSGAETVYATIVMTGGPYYVKSGNYTVTIHSLLGPSGTEIYYENTFTFGGSEFKLVSYFPSTLTSWNPEISFTVTNDGDFPSICNGYVALNIEMFYEGQWDNLQVLGPTSEGTFILNPGETQQFHLEIPYITSTWQDVLRSQTMDAWFDPVGTSTPEQQKITLTFPSS
jgi:hypothetical protein